MTALGAFGSAATFAVAAFRQLSIDRCPFPPLSFFAQWSAAIAAVLVVGALIAGVYRRDVMYRGCFGMAVAGLAGLIWVAGVFATFVASGDLSNCGG